jgi:hypothetical protein
MKIDRITNEQIAAIESATKNIPIPNQPEVNLEMPSSDSDMISGMNEAFAMKQRLYEKVLAPQLEENEKLKREQKTDLMNNIFIILKWQFIATYVFVLVVLIALLCSTLLGIPEKVAIEAISFIKFYITSIIVELISILFFIVKNVFDTSIVDLFKNFDKSKDKKDPQD